MSRPKHRVFPKPVEPERSTKHSGIRLRRKPGDSQIPIENETRPIEVVAPPPPLVPQELSAEGQRKQASSTALEQGRRLMQLERPEQAVRYLMRAVSMDPDSADCQAELGWALYLSAPESPKRLEQSHRVLNRAIELGPLHATAHYYFARVLEARGSNAAARNYLHAAVQLGSQEARQHLEQRRTRRWWRR